jgi:16S rRNA (cytidine1402-2'-O)-methyltransferase
MPGRLVLCATPIGNLGDASDRLRETLADADRLYAEDTRRTATLLRHLGIDRPMRSYFTGNEAERATELAAHLEAGETVALVTDAGMPAIADPGLSAVRAAVAVGAEVSVVPGPSAATAALAVSGLPAERFVFEGFLPRKGGPRQRRLAELETEHRTVVLFSAARRVADDLTDLAATLGVERDAVVVRELTKVHEEVWRGTLGAAAVRWSDDVAPRGEFTVVVAGAAELASDPTVHLPEVRALVSRGIPASAAVREVAEARGVSRRGLYEAYVRDRDGV